MCIQLHLVYSSQFSATVNSNIANQMAIDSLRAMSALCAVHSAVVAPETDSSATANPTATSVFKCRSKSSGNSSSALKRKHSTLYLMNPEVDEGEEDPMVSGWGEAEDMKEDLLKDWGEVLEKWNGKQKEKTRPKQLSKLCRKVSQVAGELLGLQAIFPASIAAVYMILKPFLFRHV